MSTFDDREKAQEAKFAHDAELRFKAEARRNKLLGLWAAEQMGLSEEHARKYATEVVEADFQEAGDEDVFRKVAEDLKAKGAPPVPADATESWIPSALSTLTTVPSCGFPSSLKAR